jgi:omega-6 fatty acid desaturase (delta-12 desaturase)
MSRRRVPLAKKFSFLVFFFNEKAYSRLVKSPSGHHRPKSSPQWYRDLARFQDSKWAPAISQIATSILPYLAVMALMFIAVTSGLPYFLVLIAAVPAALFLIRTFIIFHDCTHGSFMPSKRANTAVGFIAGVLTFTPFEPWRVSHLRHHATNGQLDHRGFGDVDTMTFEEYQAAGPWRRFLYRVYRHPFVLFFLGSIWTFLILHRFQGIGKSAKETRSVILTNLALAGLAVGLSLWLGFEAYVAVQLPVIFLAGVIGIWLFYIQHQFDPSYWEHDENWEKIDAALYGASHYQLPPILQWFTGNIGIHHVHHLRPRIPNYRLQRAYTESPETHVPNPLTLLRSLGAIRLNLWSETQKRFMSFREAARSMRASG